MADDLLPQGEKLRRAVRWISDRRIAEPGVDIKKLVNEAGLRFDLPPLDQDYLWRTFVTGATGG